jgi:hypothetical protein
MHGMAMVFLAVSAVLVLLSVIANEPTESQHVVPQGHRVFSKPKEAWEPICNLDFVWAKERTQAPCRFDPILNKLLLVQGPRGAPNAALAQCGLQVAPDSIYQLRVSCNASSDVFLDIMSGEQRIPRESSFHGLCTGLKQDVVRFRTLTTYDLSPVFR